MKKLKQYFTKAEIDYLLHELKTLALDGVGPEELGVPLHGHHNPDRHEFLTAKEILTTRKVGSSWTVENKLRLRPFIKAASTHGFKIVTKRLPLGEYRVWKLDDPKNVKNAKKRAERKSNT